VLGVAAAPAGEISLRIVNVVTPQNVKIREPTSIFAKKGDTVMLQTATVTPRSMVRDRRIP